MRLGETGVALVTGRRGVCHGAVQVDEVVVQRALRRDGIMQAPATERKCDGRRSVPKHGAWPPAPVLAAAANASGEATAQRARGGAPRELCRVLRKRASAGREARADALSLRRCGGGGKGKGAAIAH